MADNATHSTQNNDSPMQSIAQSTPREEDASTTAGSSIPSTCQNEELILSGKRGLKSEVWNHYKRQKIDDKWKAICKYCEKKLGGDTKNGTKHLHDHYAICSRKKGQDIRQALLKSNVDASGKRSLGNYVYDQEVARKKMATMIIMHEYPLQMVEHVGFRDFLSSVQPLFKPISRPTLKSDIMKIYEHEKSRTMKLFDQNRSKFAITTDMWTCNNQRRGFMAVTAHYIDDDWILRSQIIRFIYVPCPHTSEVLCEVLVNCLMDWNLDNKLSTLTLDNCSTNDLLASLIVNKLSSTNLWIDGKFLHMRCCAHILNLIVKDGLDVINDAIENIRDSVAFWVATPKRIEKFEETVRQLKMNFTKKLVLDCKTRWNSIFFMLNVAIGYKDAFKRLKQRESLYKCCPSDDEWEKAKEICNRLKIFHSVTELFSGTKYPMANLYFPKICQISIALTKWVSCGIDYIESMALRMKSKFEKYWNKIHGVMGVAIVLDPRFKLVLLEMYFPMVYGEDKAKDEIQKIRTFCYDLVGEYSSTLKLNESSSFVDNSSQLLANEDDAEFINNYQLFVASRGCQMENVKSELDAYLEESVLPMKADFDILSWWKNALKYPTLQLIARDILAIPVSTVASESAFSTSGRFINPQRSRLHPNTIEALMCTQDWLKDSCFWSRIHPICSTFDEDIEEEDENDEEGLFCQDASGSGIGFST